MLVVLKKTQQLFVKKLKKSNTCRTLTSRGSLRLLSFLTVQIFEQLHGLPRHDNLFEDGFEEGHHCELPVAGALIPSGAPAGRVIQLFLIVHHF